MSKVAIKGNASGTGTFTLEAPNSNTDRTLTLPDEAGTVLSSGTPLSSFPSGFANGITEVDQWRINSNYTPGSAGDFTVTSNWERVDEPSFSKIGTGMSESSGIFTFPSTGLWRVEAVGRYFDSSAYSYAAFMISISNDGGSSYNQATEGYVNGSANSYATGYSSILINVANISNIKVRFQTRTSTSTSQIQGHTDENQTYVSFMRVGDAQ